MPATDESRADSGLWGFAKRALIAIAIAAAIYLLWRARLTALMAFAAVIVAVLLLALTDLFRRFVPLGQSWALAAAIMLVFLVLGAMGWLVGAQVQAQVAEVWQRLPQGIEAVEERLGIQLTGGGEQGGADQQRQQARGAEPSAGQGGTQAAQDSLTGQTAGRLAGWATSFGFTVVDAVLSTILAIIAGAYLAAQPTLYRRGLAKLFPPRQHERVSETLSAMGAALRGWLIGVLISMLIVGVLTGSGLWLIGVPAPLALGLFAGLTEFVPIIGPIVGAVPALLLALTEGGSTFLWTLLLFVIIQQLESNLIAPLVQREMVSVPPALFVLAIAAFGALFGILGVIVAAPLLGGHLHSGQEAVGAGRPQGENVTARLGAAVAAARRPLPVGLATSGSSARGRRSGPCRNELTDARMGGQADANIGRRHLRRIIATNRDTERKPCRGAGATA